MSTENIREPLDETGITGESKPVMSVTELLPGVESNFKIHRGKVRDSVDLGDKLLVVATDRISTFDSVHPTGIPDKGKVLTRMTLKWLDLLGVPNHLVKGDFVAESLRDRSMLVEKLQMIPIECIVRGYITGSAWSEYRETGAVSGIKLPPGLVEAQKLDEPLFTPSTKAVVGHDENIDFATMAGIIRMNFENLDEQRVASKLKERSILIYKNAADYALSRGVIIADTKFEFGIDENTDLLLADEVLTPDSSRFWDASTYEPGRSQQSLDKQYVRDYVTSIGWNKKPPAPSLPEDVVLQTKQRYDEAYRRLFG